MKKIFCDINGCKNEAYSFQSVDVCCGYKLSSEGGGVNEKYKAFEKPTIKKMDLCDKHYKKWLRATYLAFWKIEISA